MKFLRYPSLLRPLLFSFPGETAHRIAMGGLSLSRHLRLTPLLRRACRFEHPALATTVFGLSFKNPIGLAAGFDKNGDLPEVWPALGFGHVELGTVTGRAQPGNPPPRLFRLVEDRALINRMGFNNIGAVAFKQRFEKKRHQGLPPAIYGINIGKSKITPLKDAATEYADTFASLSPLADYITINVSSPNTPGLRILQGKDELREILAAVQARNLKRLPVLLKIAPDLTLPQLDEILDLATTHRLSGIIATNTTLSRSGLASRSFESEAGGLSGAPLKKKSTEIIRHIYQQTAGALPIIGVGGIETAQDVYDKIRAGASLVQVYTGFIYEGPCLINRLNRGLLALLNRDGLSNVQEAVGRSANHAD